MTCLITDVNKKSGNPEGSVAHAVEGLLGLAFLSGVAYAPSTILSTALVGDE
jgi:hypothetical protein